MIARLAVPVAAALVLLAAGCGGGKQASTSAAPGPPQLSSIAELQAAFNSAAGAPTLVVLISPT